MRVGELAKPGGADEADDVLLLHRLTRIATQGLEQRFVANPRGRGHGRYGDPGPAVHHDTSELAPATAAMRIVRSKDASASITERGRVADMTISFRIW